MEKTPLFKNLRLMDNRIKDNKNKNLDGACINVSNFQEGEALARALISRNIYEEVHMSFVWNKETNSSYFRIFVYWA